MKVGSDTDTDSDPHDDRPLVKDLLEQHAASIDGVRQQILSDETVGKPLWNERYDDIWILRYVLSHKGNVERATKNALKTMKMRDEMKLNNEEFSDMRRRLKNYGNCASDAADVESLPHFDSFNSFLGKDSYIVLSQPDPDRGVLLYGDMGDVDMEGMMASMSEQQAIEHLVYQNEAVYQILDEVTRRTGKLTKLTRNMDFANFSLFKLNYKFAKQTAAVAKDIEEYHPHVLAGITIFNTPAWINGIWTVMKPLFPKRVIGKIDFLSVKASRKLHKPILKHISEANLPENFGGKNQEWPPPSIAETMK